jgi:hypothetical protein
MIDPLVDELATEFAGKVACVKLNTDASPETASRFGVRSVPTVMLFKGGQRLDTIVGAVPKATLAQAVEKVCCLLFVVCFGLGVHGGACHVCRGRMACYPNPQHTQSPRMQHNTKKSTFERPNHEVKNIH